MSEYKITLSDDEVLVLFEYFERIEETGNPFPEHPAEYLALQRIAGQVCDATPATFKADYGQSLERARERLAEGFDGDVPWLKAGDP